MVEKVCNLWLEKADYRCVPTSGAVAPDGSALLDVGLATDAAKRFNGFDQDLGRMIAARGNHVHVVRPGLCSFPVKQFQWSKPSLDIITRSARELMELVGDAKTLLPRPGCGPNELTWEEVSAALSFLPDNIIVVQHV